MRKMQCLGDFVANNAKIESGGRRFDNQGSNGYPSFIVRLSFVIGSFNLRGSYMVLGVW